MRGFRPSDHRPTITTERGRAPADDSWLQPASLFLGQHDTGAVRTNRNHFAGFGNTFDGFALLEGDVGRIRCLLLGQIAHFKKKPSTNSAAPHVRPSRPRSMRGEDEPELLQVGHHVAH